MIDLPCAIWNIRRFNNPDKVLHCKQFIKKFGLQFFAILENRINMNSMLNYWFISNHYLFENEKSFHNFNISSSGRIWLKWNSNITAFIPVTYSEQYIYGKLKIVNMSFIITIVYASNDYKVCSILWEDIRKLAPINNDAWLVIGNFNCYRMN